MASMKSSPDSTLAEQANRVQLEVPSGRSPLSKLLRSIYADQEMRRIRFFARFFDGFHLKNTVTSDVSGRKIILDGKSVINFGSANYLGFDQHPETTRASEEAIRRWGNHSGCSRIFSSQENMILLEHETAQLVGAQRTLVSVNVSQIHQGTIPALFSGSDCTLFMDRFGHTSMFQAAQVAKARGAAIVSVDSANTESLTKALSENRSRRKVLLVDGVYSMQGHVPELARVQEICNATGTVLYIDDAHGIGVFGENGGGVVEELGLSFENMILVGGFQKGLGSYGAFVAGSASLIDCIRTLSRTYIFSGPLQPQAVDGSRAAIRLCRSEEGRVLRKKLREHSRLVRSELRGLQVDVPLGESPIVPVSIGDEILTLMAGRRLYDDGIYLNSVLFPAVPRGEGILRISLTALHSDDEIRSLIVAFRNLKDYMARNSGAFRGRLHFALEMLRETLRRRKGAP